MKNAPPIGRVSFDGVFLSVTTGVPVGLVRIEIDEAEIKSATKSRKKKKERR